MFLDNVLNSYRLDIVEKLWIGGAWILRFQNRNPFVFQILGDWRERAFSQGTYKFQNLRNETLAIADHLHVKISKLALFNVKLLLKEDNILHTLIESNWMNTTSNLSVNQSLVHVQLRIFENTYMFVISNLKSLIPQNVKLVGPFGKELIYFCKYICGSRQLHDNEWFHWTRRLAYFGTVSLDSLQPWLRCLVMFRSNFRG